MDLTVPPIPQAGRIGADQDLAILMEIGRILSSTLDLRESFQKMMQIISEKLDMRRGSLVLLDESTGRLRTEAAVGLTPEEIERGNMRWAKESPATSSQPAEPESFPMSAPSPIS